MNKLTLETFNNLPIRDHIGSVLNDHNMLGSVAEVGVLFGSFARMVLTEWKGERYYAVDPWERQSGEVYKERTEHMDYELAYRQVREMAKQDTRICMLRGMSVTMARFIPDNSLDLCFIDGNHAYGPVLEDMDAWWPKVRPGGIFSGHDYGDDTNPPHWCEVKSAVDRWMYEHDVDFALDKHGSSWWSIKA